MKTIHKLAFGIFLSLLAGGAADAQVLGYWTFEEQAPGNAASNTTNAIVDISGNSHNGTIADTGVFYVAGNSNYAGTSALEFTLGPDHIAVPDPTGAFNYSASQSITLEAMIKTTTIGQDGIGSIVCKQGANPGEWWWRINANGTQQFYSDDSTGGRSASGTRRLNDGRWHHIAAVFDSVARQSRVYVDYVQDGAAATASFTPGNVIGNTQDMWIAAFQAGNRQFAGDIDFVRITAAALAPTNFVQPQTFITGVTPADGSQFLSATNVAGFEVKSTPAGVLTNGIHVAVNGTDISSQLLFSGNVNDWLVGFPALAANRQYRVQISVTDQLGHQTFETNTFDTFTSNLFSFEAEDYNFGGGQFIDNPQLQSADGPNNYLDRIGTQGIDFNKLTNAATTLYRIGDAVGTAVSGDVLRQAYIDAQVSDPGVADYTAFQFVDTEWVNYTRTFPAGSYHVFARLAKTGALLMTLRLDQVTSDATQPAQTTTPIGNFIGQPTATAQTYESVALTDAMGREISVPLSGLETLRVSMLTGITGMSMNYFEFVPEGGVQVPYPAALAPAPGADNEATNTSVHVTIRNGDTSINTGTIQLKLDAATVTPTVTATATGAQIDYIPTSVTVGLHTNTLVFADSAATLVTNIWTFRVASPAVRGLWYFNEKAPGNTVSIATGAIVDSSGNGRNGTVNDASQQYVSGSFNYSNTSALRFTSGFDSMVVPDNSGAFNYTGSFTWEAVVRSSTTGTNLAILSKNGTGDGEGEYWWRLPGTSGGVQTVEMNDLSGLKILSGTTPLTDGNWHHVAVVYDTNALQIRLYADYNLEATLTNVVFTNVIGRPAPLTIGSFYGGGSEFDGDIDTIRLSSGALTTAQFIQTTVALSPISKTNKPNTNALNVFPTAQIENDFLNRDTQVAASTFKMYIDGNDVSAGTSNSTAGSTVSIFYKPTSPLADGQHTVLVTFNDTAVPPNFVTNQWKFTVVNNEPILAFFQFNEQTPGSAASTATNAIIDSSGKNRNGTSSAAINYVAGSTNYGSSSALEFTTAAGSHVSFPDPTNVFAFPPTQSMTFEAVIKAGATNNNGNFISKQNAQPGEWYFRIVAGTGVLRFSANDGTGLKTATGTKSLNDGKYHHVAAEYDAVAKQMRVYVDYVQDGASVATTFSTNIGNTNEDVWMGNQQNGGAKFDGDIDMLRVTGAALDTSWFIPIGGIVPSVKLVNVQISGTNISFGVPTANGHTYFVQSTGNIGSGWTDIQTIPGDGTTNAVSYGITGTRQFFRVRFQ